jgi:hypothetical protein
MNRFCIALALALALPTTAAAQDVVVIVAEDPPAPPAAPDPPTAPDPVAPAAPPAEPDPVAPQPPAAQPPVAEPPAAPVAQPPILQPPIAAPAQPPVVTVAGPADAAAQAPAQPGVPLLLIPVPATQPSAACPACPEAPPILLYVVAEDPGSAPEPAAAAEPVAAPEPAASPAPAEPTRFVPGPLSLGLSGLVGTRPDRGGDLAPSWTAGFDVGFRLAEWIAVGARRITVAGGRSFGGDLLAPSASPYVELAWRPWERVEGYGQAGAALQLRIENGDLGGLGISPFVGAGVRFFVADCFSIAAEGAAHLVLGDRHLFGSDVYPDGALLLQGGLAFAFHIR